MLLSISVRIFLVNISINRFCSLAVRLTKDAGALVLKSIGDLCIGIKASNYGTVHGY